MNHTSKASIVDSDRCDEITRTAAVLFDRLGYHETSMDDIAREVGLKKPTLYYYVSSKSEIVYRIHEKLQAEYKHRLQARIDRGVPPAQNLLEVMYDILDIMERYPGHLRVYFENHRNLPAEYKESVAKTRDQYFTMVESVIVEGIERGEFRPTDSRLTTLALFGICNWSYQWYNPAGPLRAREIAYHLWDVFMRGVASPGLLGQEKDGARAAGDRKRSSVGRKSFSPKKR
jgi:TetR/AcrR family transcriptional regulator, cholesterol catabolism regulator